MVRRAWKRRHVPARLPLGCAALKKQPGPGVKCPGARLLLYAGPTGGHTGKGVEDIRSKVKTLFGLFMEKYIIKI